MKVVGKGNANILIDFGDAEYLYRCLVRYESLKMNNDCTRENFGYINDVVRKSLGSYVCEMELLEIPLTDFELLLKELSIQIDDTSLVVLKIINLKSKDYTNTLKDDHCTKIFADETATKILLEIKPKWLHYSTDYCRNCTHNTYKNRGINYCYSKLLKQKDHIYDILNPPESLPIEFLNDIVLYLEDEKNFLQLLYSLQEHLHSETTHLSNIDSEDKVTKDLLLLMTLRDVTCFLEWHSLNRGKFSVNIIDVDLKPKHKWKHWSSTHEALEFYNPKCYHK
ncbi:hypothetical protein Kpol_1005p13 [Vanderwaltozyma polyspora DSM 70294]|uniref:Inositol-pentakisphosphate 2-kinase n=1 Tax=Vanderwaltozyma polyspora (strain ATCC 22028 / DSM 70294 / BCRC 21397 / CBS 2163 / NBRC 10782 / NRRL Y-8283 / UCD 57-17) TaxID=436907 RepID=A7TS39_VANPO|nr:uncharacterized protein Kpol_1005p13 [Vanderwaltozyma polyspora DSM 70294]EDO14925.1 hypothetical protein Kpol_1005p13 [Vanderwaltozyma polyspora DSM 70294]